MSALDLQYQEVLRRLLTEGIEEFHERTGHKTKSLPGVTFQVDLAESFPLITLRKIPIKIFVAEQIWFIMGSRRPDEFLREFTQIWDDFTNIGGVVTSAYGYRMRHHFDRDQLGLLIRLLEEEPTSRHGVVVFWDPSDDGLSQSRKKKNVPCPYTFTVNLIGDRLHLHLMIRSNDMILGFPHDIGGFALLAYILAERLKVEPGTLTHSISNAHIYDVHYQTAEEIIKRPSSHSPIYFCAPAGSFERAEKGERGLVEEIVQMISSQYNPAQAISGLKVVL